MKQSLVELSRYVADRTARRLADLTGGEYAWTPVADGWHLRPNGQGGIELDWPDPAPDPPRVLARQFHHRVAR